MLGGLVSTAAPLHMRPNGTGWIIWKGWVVQHRAYLGAYASNGRAGPDGPLSTAWK